MILRSLLLVLFIVMPLCVHAEDAKPQDNQGYVEGKPPADSTDSAKDKDRLTTLKEFLHSPKTISNPIKCIQDIDDWTRKNLW